MVIHSPGPVCGPPGATHCWQQAGGQCNLYKQRTSRIKKNVDDRLMQTHGCHGFIICGQFYLSEYRQCMAQSLSLIYHKSYENSKAILFFLVIYCSVV